MYKRQNQQHVITSVNALVDTITQAMQEERASEKSKDELITNVSHDLRTPLTSIKMCIRDSHKW